MELSEKVAYIKGLINGFELDEDNKEVKVINAVVDVLDEMSLAISELQDENDELYEGLDAIDEDLSLLEQEVFENAVGAEYEDDFDYDDEELDKDTTIYEVVCPKCKEVVYLNEEMLEQGKIECPSCKEILEFDIDEIKDDDTIE